MISYLIIVNPTSGRGGARQKAELLKQSLSDTCTVRIVETSGRGSAAKISALSAAKVDRIIAAGGDGTLNEVLAGLMKLNCPAHKMAALGFLPAGTFNAAKQVFGFTADPNILAAALHNARVCPVDVGVARTDSGKRPFLLWCGAGFDAVVIDSLNTSRTGQMGISKIVYNLPCIFRDIVKYSAPLIRINVDGTDQDAVSSAIIANAADMAFGGTVAESADPFDAKLDVVTIKTTSMFKLAALGLRMLFSDLAGADSARHKLGTKILLKSGRPVPVQVDGEPAGFLPLTIHIQPAAVQLLLPQL